MKKESAKRILIGFFAIVVASSLVGTVVLIFPQRQSSNQIVQKALTYINELVAPQGLKAELLSLTEESGLYKMTIKIGEETHESYVTKDGRLLFPMGINLERRQIVQEERAKEKRVSTIGNFLVSEDEICRENEKPIVYFFGSSKCPHCLWQHPIFEKVVKKFEGYISTRIHMDSQADMDVFRKYSEGGVPTIVLGCKYYRVGSGQRMGEEQETKVLTALICKLTENRPAEVCNQVKDLIDQINE